MIFTIKSHELRKREGRERERNWNPWFAWHPIRITETKIAWFETVYRRKVVYDKVWEYSKTNPIKDLS